MDLQAEKIRLIEWLAGVNDTEILTEFITLKEEKEKDWWDEISDEERAEIRHGMDQADEAELLTHEEVMSKYKEWL